MKNDTKTVIEPPVPKVNKTKINETAKRVENKMEKCTKLKEMGSSEGNHKIHYKTLQSNFIEGKRTLPYRVTLTERPKLINRKKDADDSLKAEMPIQIACCTGKPYKLKTVKKSEPVNIDGERPEPKGFAPVKLLPRDSSVEILEI